jgi:hypothetical protein
MKSLLYPVRSSQCNGYFAKERSKRGKKLEVQIFDPPACAHVSRTNEAKVVLGVRTEVMLGRRSVFFQSLSD